MHAEMLQRSNRACRSIAFRRFPVQRQQCISCVPNDIRHQQLIGTIVFERNLGTRTILEIVVNIYSR
jgi:hypothetical protein